MKSELSIKNIAIAAIKRHAIDFEKWHKTKIDPIGPFPVSCRESEEAVVFLHYSNESWTLITTRRIIGKIDNILREVEFADMEQVLFDHAKHTNTETTRFRAVDISGVNQDYMMEPGTASIAYIYGIQTIKSAYMTKA